MTVSLSQGSCKEGPICKAVTVSRAWSTHSITVALLLLPSSSSSATLTSRRTVSRSGSCHCCDSKPHVAAGQAPSTRGPAKSRAHGSAPPAHSCLTAGGRSLYTRTPLPAPHPLPLKSQESICSSAASCLSPVFALRDLCVSHVPFVSEDFLDAFYPSVLEEQSASLAVLAESPSPTYMLGFV